MPQTVQWLPKPDKHVASDLRKVTSGTALSPVLLLRGDGVSPLIVAEALGTTLRNQSPP